MADLEFPVDQMKSWVENVALAAAIAGESTAHPTGINIRDFGAAGDGVTDDTAVIASAMQTGLRLVFPAGTYALASTNFTSSVKLMDGAMLKSDGDTVLAFNSGFSAPIGQVFDFTGNAKATFNKAKTKQGFAEWWGAVPGYSTSDCTAAFNAALLALSETGMMPVAYFVNDTIKMQTDHSRLFGAGKSWTSAGGTQIISNSDSATIIKMGLDSNPGSVNGNIQHLYLDSFTINRNVEKIDSNSSCYGIDAAWILFGHITDVESINSKICFNSSGDVQLFKTNCYAFRHLEGTVPANDSFYGFFYNGHSGLPLAGGNASVYDRDCTANCSLNADQLPINIGFALDGKPADYFSYGCEVTACMQGLFINGSGTIGGDADIRIDDFKADGIILDAIFITGFQGAIRITNSYGAASVNAKSFTGLRAVNSSGIMEDGNQWICWPAPNSCGVSFTSVSSSSIGEGTIILDASRPIELHGVYASKIKAAVKNKTVPCTQGAVLYDQGTTRCEMAISLAGDSQGIFQYGYRSPDNSCTSNKLDWSAMAVTGFPSSDPARRLSINGKNLGTTVGPIVNNSLTVGMAA